MSLASEYGAAVVCMCIDEEGQARTADRKVADRPRIRDLAVDRYGLEPDRPAVRLHTLPLATGIEESRQDGIETIEGIRRIKTELPGVWTVLGAVEHQLRSQARGPARAEQRVPPRVPGGGARRRDRARGAHHADAQASTSSGEVTLDLIYDRRRDGYDPLTEFMALFEGVDADAVEREDRSGWTVEERLKHRIIDGDRDGLEDDLEEQLDDAARARRSSTTCCSRA